MSVLIEKKKKRSFEEIVEESIAIKEEMEHHVNKSLWKLAKNAYEIEVNYKEPKLKEFAEAIGENYSTVLGWRSVYKTYQEIRRRISELANIAREKIPFWSWKELAGLSTDEAIEILKEAIEKDLSRREIRKLARAFKQVEKEDLIDKMMKEFENKEVSELEEIRDKIEELIFAIAPFNCFEGLVKQLEKYRADLIYVIKHKKGEFLVGVEIGNFRR